MGIKILILAGLKRHRGALLGIFLLITLTATVTGTVLTLWTNAAHHEETGLTQAGFGELTAWVSGEADTESLTEEITNLTRLGRVQGVTQQELKDILSKGDVEITFTLSNS